MFNFFLILTTKKSSDIILYNISLRRRSYLWCCFPLTRVPEYPVEEKKNPEYPIAMMTNQIWELNIPSTNQRDLRNGPISEEQRLTGINRKCLEQWFSTGVPSKVLGVTPISELDVC